MSARCASLSEMMANRAWQTLLLSCFAFSSITVILANGPVPKQDRSWKRYYNPQWRYCVNYPVRWRKGDAFDGSGIFIETGVKRLSNPLGEMDIAALTDQTDAHLTLIDTMQVHLEGLKKFERAQQMELLDERPMELSGNSALFAKERYYDPLERTKWVDELVFAERQNVLFRLELECRADQLPRFEPVFARFVSTFQFDCAQQP